MKLAIFEVEFYIRCNNILNLLPASLSNKVFLVEITGGLAIYRDCNLYRTYIKSFYLKQLITRTYPISK